MTHRKGSNSIIALQDVRLNRASQISIPNHKFFIKNSNTLTGIPKAWKAELIDSDCPEEISILMEDDFNHKFILINVYHRPRKDIPDSLLEHMSNVVTEYKNLPIFIVGDFNAPHESFGSRTTSRAGDKLSDWILDTGMKNIKSESPTYYSNSKSGAWNILDLIIVNDKAEKVIDNVSQGRDLGSDHIPFLIDLKFKSKTGKFQITKINRHNQRLDAENELSKLIPINDFPSTQEIDDYTEEISKILTNSKSINTFVRNIRFKDGVELSERSEFLLKEMRRTSNRRRNNDSEETRKKCNYLKKAFRASVKDDEAKDYVRRIKRCAAKNDSRKKWTTINEVLDRQRKDNQPLTNLQKQDGTKTKSVEEIVEVHAIRLQSSCSPADEPWMNNDFKNQIEEEVRVNENLFLPLKEPLSEDRDEEILRHIPSDSKLQQDIQKLKKFAAPGEDGLTNEDLMNTGPNFRFHFIRLLRACFMKGYFPRSFKNATVKMLLKPQKPADVSKNYRPISLTNTMAKLIEKYMTNAFEKILDKYGPKLPRQCGFEPNRSTMEGVIKLVADINTANKRNGCVVAAFLDCARAFDCVWHDGIRAKLKCYHIPPKLTRLISNYLRDRTMTVKEGTTFSRAFPITAGVPQGGIISPSLFKFYLSDIPISRDENESGSAYADDTCFWGSAYNATQAASIVQFALNGFEYWARAWRVLPEPSKSNCIIFSRNPSIRKQTFSLTLLGEPIPRKKVATLLGVDLDEHLTWKQNTEKMIGKAIPTINSIKKLVPIFGKTCPSLVHECFDSLFTSIFQYSAPAWINMASNQWEKIENLQKKAIRSLYHLPPKISNSILFHTTGEIPIKTTLTRQATKRIHKILDNTAGIMSYLWDYKDFCHVEKHPSLLEFFMEHPDTPFGNHHMCPGCCFNIHHACTFHPPDFQS